MIALACSDNNTISVSKYKIILIKLWRLRKLIGILNLLTINIVFTILSFKKKNELIFC
jgi:hypothetical protein